LGKRDDIDPRPPSVSVDGSGANTRPPAAGPTTRIPANTRAGGPRTREIERYAALFAERTRVMRSSAMRDLMALTEREDVISLAGGMPDTSTFPADSYAALMTTIASESCARAL
jgi:2-aminoadipate transaminase